ncbi:LuxR C-terminal-related transcriptional regulator [Rodentibacter trehalosifermentans]|uniref:LuxR C-terminal-related transcriptional regulator n=1 Tax=Rodentibacter trehalosifermentans TaxID=1908263 RepID=UPI0026891F70
MPELTVKLVSKRNDNPFEQLTKRELQICELLSQGLEPKEIGENLGLSFKTIHTHRANIMSKLAVKNNVELTNLFHQYYKV